MSLGVWKEYGKHYSWNVNIVVSTYFIIVLGIHSIFDRAKMVRSLNKSV